MSAKSFGAWKAMIGNKPISKDQRDLIRAELKAEQDELMRQCAERKAEREAEHKAKKQN